MKFDGMWLLAAVLVFLGFVIGREIHYYRIGWGRNFHIVDLKQQDAWVKPFPTKWERQWLLITIIGEILMLLIIGIPTVFILMGK